MTKKWRLLFPVIMILCIGIISIILWHYLPFRLSQKPIKIGILHSLSGDLAISEQPVANATLLAIKEINDAGGILGRQIEPLLVDGKSDEKIFAEQAERLITQENVVAIFGGWTSPSRMAIKTVVEKHNSLLFYPVQFEGLEDSPNIAYTSTTANQQIFPGVTWCLKNLGKRVFLVGSDELLNEIIKDVVYAQGGEIVGVEYLSLQDKNVDPIIDKIIASKPDVIINNIEGTPNILFFTRLREKGITPEKIPTMSFSISEPELQYFNIDAMTGDYATWSYFESIDSQENKTFIKKIKAAYGEKQPVSDAMESAYFGVYFWKQAIEQAQSTDAKLVRSALNNQAFDAPQGIVHIAEKSLLSWSFARVGKIRSDKQFTILWSSQKAIRPMPYPPTRSIDEWEKLRSQILEKEGIQ